MSRDISDVTRTMTDAARTSLSSDWPKLKEYADSEFKRLASALADITRLRISGEINDQQAKALFQIHKNTAQMVFLTIEGLGIIAVENAVNAALAAIADLVNDGIGFPLL